MNLLLQAIQEYLTEHHTGWTAKLIYETINIEYYDVSRFTDILISTRHQLISQYVSYSHQHQSAPRYVSEHYSEYTLLSQITKMINTTMGQP